MFAIELIKTQVKVGDKVIYVKDMLGLNCSVIKGEIVKDKKEVAGVIYKLNKDFLTIHYPQNQGKYKVVYHSAKYNEIEL